MFSMKQQNFYLIIWRSCFNHSTTPIVNMHLMHCSEYWSKVSLSCCSCFSWLVCEHCEPSESEQIRIKITIGQIEKNFRALPIFCPNCACDRNSRETRDSYALLARIPPAAWEHWAVRNLVATSSDLLHRCTIQLAAGCSEHITAVTVCFDKLAFQQ